MNVQLATSIATIIGASSGAIVAILHAIAVLQGKANGKNGNGTSAG